ncbi:odorant receptor 30a-like [Musca autumnalis]|uniref:odorant receptor 30a-like n=1 Tax=Musca autumnalis TaxID=221902 RepID=UPI003CECFF1D
MKIRSIEDVPLLSTNLRIMKFWSFLLDHNWRRYFALIPYIFINTTQFLDIYFSKEPIDVIVRNAYVAVLFFDAIVRAVLVCFNRFEYEEFMEKIQVLYDDLVDSEDAILRKMLRECTVASRFISKVNLIMGCSSSVAFNMYPLFATTRVLPFGIYVPGIDKYETPYYQICFLFQLIITPAGCCMYLPFTNLIVSFILFCILMCKVLQHKLRNLKDVSNEKAREGIVWCIKYQLKLINFVDTINDLTTYIFLFEFMAFGVMLCAMLFLLVIVETVGQMVVICSYIFLIFGQSVIMYYFANELYDESLKVAIAAYESNWFDFDVSTQKTIKLLILRAQKPCAILVGKVYPMNLEMFQSLLNATYSYFTLLKRLYG